MYAYPEWKPQGLSSLYIQRSYSCSWVGHPPRAPSPTESATFKSWSSAFFLYSIWPEMRRSRTKTASSQAPLWMWPSVFCWILTIIQFVWFGFYALKITLTKIGTPSYILFIERWVIEISQAPIDLYLDLKKASSLNSKARPKDEQCFQFLFLVLFSILFLNKNVNAFVEENLIQNCLLVVLGSCEWRSKI